MWKRAWKCGAAPSPPPPSWSPRPPCPTAKNWPGWCWATAWRALPAAKQACCLRRPAPCWAAAARAAACNRAWPIHSVWTSWACRKRKAWKPPSSRSASAFQNAPTSVSSRAPPPLPRSSNCATNSIPASPCRSRRAPIRPSTCCIPGPSTDRSRGTGARRLSPLLAASTILASAAVPTRDRQQVPVPARPPTHPGTGARRLSPLLAASTILASAAVPTRDRQQVPVPAHPPTHPGTGARRLSPLLAASTILASAAVPTRDRQQVPVPAHPPTHPGTGARRLSPLLAASTILASAAVPTRDGQQVPVPGRPPANFCNVRIEEYVFQETGGKLGVPSSRASIRHAFSTQPCQARLHRRLAHRRRPGRQGGTFHGWQPAGPCPDVRWHRALPVCVGIRSRGRISAGRAPAGSAQRKSRAQGLCQLVPPCAIARGNAVGRLEHRRLRDGACPRFPINAFRGDAVGRHPRRKRAIAMTPQRQLHWANFWSAVGMLPFGLVVSWAALFSVTTTPGKPPAIPILDPIGMIGLGIMTLL